MLMMRLQAANAVVQAAYLRFEDINEGWATILKRTAALLY
jgi:hypothetical protein